VSTAPLFLGLISGTSVDAIDAALVAFEPQPRLVAAKAIEYAPALRERILAAGLGDGITTFQEIGTLDVAIGRAFADAALALLDASGTDAAKVRAIGSHGQTLWHAPRGAFPFTLQLGDANIIAERTGIDTVADFRRRDMAAGGEGAPLVPAFHAAFLRSADEDRAVLNLGGIANLSLLLRGQSVRGFDTGPANTLLDVWVEKHRGQRFDADGAFAATGRCHAPLLARMLDDPYFARPAPKSTGRDHFNLAWIERCLEGFVIGAEDVQATLLALTARSIGLALRREAPAVRRLLVCGGGARNRQMLAALAAEFDDVAVETTDGHGLDTDAMESMAFAWLARETIEGRPGNLPDVTGARGPRILGGIYRA
jgi:anhydro-N-acetylmuramic acid kinase